MRATVGGHTVAIQATAPLAANGDPFAAMMLLPAARRGATLRLAADVDAQLHANVPAINEIAQRYWKFRGASLAPTRLVTRAPRGGGAMFFTGGIDSFHTLRRRLDELERLIFIHGFDIGLEDDARFLAAREWIEGVASELGREAQFVRTDLRSQPEFDQLSWGITHVGALAAVAHALAPVVSRVFIASSDVQPPWGSNPELDPLWSSAAVAIVNDGSESTRLGKVRAIADWQPVHRYLKVCFENRVEALNCGVCEKCVRSQAQFAVAGALGKLQTFPPGSLVERIDGVKWVQTELATQWREIRAHIADRAAEAAIDRLLARQPSIGDWLQRNTKALRRTAAGRLVRRVGKRLLQR